MGHSWERGTQRWGQEGERSLWPGSTGCPAGPLPAMFGLICYAGPLINTIRVLCASYEDYSHWLLCLRAASRRDGAPMLPGPESCLMPIQVRSLQGLLGRC